MKIELFDNQPDAIVDKVLEDALGVMMNHSNERIECVTTPEGYDLEIGGIEVGSYGERTVYPHGRWVYGTGMALPRFTVAQALASVI